MEIASLLRMTHSKSDRQGRSGTWQCRSALRRRAAAPDAVWAARLGVANYQLTNSIIHESSVMQGSRAGTTSCERPEIKRKEDCIKTFSKLSVVVATDQS
eukprot:6212111-Pleurochrysis_carterae.AAC.2